MRKPTSLLSSLILRNLLRRTISTQPNYLLRSSPCRRPPSSNFSNARFLSPQPFSLRPFCNSTGFTNDDKLAEEEEDDKLSNEEEEEKTAPGLLSSELLKNLDEESLPLLQKLDLSFSDIKITPNLILTTLNISPDAGRNALVFLKWVETRPGFERTDELYSYFISYFGRRKDFKAAHEILVNAKGVVGEKCFEALVDRLARADRGTQAVKLFEHMEEDYGFPRNKDSLKLIVSSLCEHGYGNNAEKMVKSLASEFFPDEEVCDMLIKGWSVAGKFDEAKRLAAEMYRGGFQIGVNGYNAMLECICKLCREKDPFRLQSESELVLLEMERKGVPRNVETFNVLITNMCKVKRTSVAMSLFDKMGEWGCYPNETTFLVLIKSLYESARIGEGDEMLDRMKAAGFGDALDKKAYFLFLKTLCGIERLEHAMSVFARMKEDGCGPDITTYDLLMKKWYAQGRVDKANALYREAESSGIPVEPKEYRLDPRFVKKSTPKKKGNKNGETLPEIKAKKRRKLRKLRSSFVRKPRKMQWTRKY